MKKGQTMEGIVTRVEFPNNGMVAVEGEDRCIVVKNAVPGQKVCVAVNKVRKGKAEGRILSITEPSPIEIPSPCPHFGECGGCTYQNLSHERQLQIKTEQVKSLMDEAVNGSYIWEGFSPVRFRMRIGIRWNFLLETNIKAVL